MHVEVRGFLNGADPRAHHLYVMSVGVSTSRIRWWVVSVVGPMEGRAQAAKLMAKIGFSVLTNMFKGQKMKIEDFLAAIAH